MRRARPLANLGHANVAQVREHLVVMRTSALLIATLLAAGACVAPASSSPTPTIAPSATASPAPVVSPSPTALRGRDLVPPVVSRAQYGDMDIKLDIPDRPGQPAEGMVWHVDPFKPDAGYAPRVASAFSMAGPGSVGEVPAGGAPGSNGPWRLWFGAKALAVNEGSGEVYFFDPSATDGPQPPGPARRDPTEVLRLLLGSFGWSADLSASPDGPTRFAGTEVTIRADAIISGAWLEPGYRETAVLFPRYQGSARQAVHVYGTDNVGLLTAKGRPAHVIHRPVGALATGEIYPITTFRQARTELLAAPLRYLHFLSNPTGEALTLTFGDAYVGSAWAGVAGEGLTHGGQLLLPVWVVTASGRSASGLPVEAIFMVDAVVPEMRAQGLGGTVNTSADTLLRFQLSTLAGQNKELLTARGAARYFLGATCEPNIATQELSASGTLSCGGPTITFTMRRAFPGLGSSSVWYLSESHK
jgi:hypothetical protein